MSKSLAVSILFSVLTLHQAYATCGSDYDRVVKKRTVQAGVSGIQVNPIGKLIGGAGLMSTQGYKKVSDLLKQANSYSSSSSSNAEEALKALQKDLKKNQGPSVEIAELAAIVRDADQRNIYCPSTGVFTWKAVVASVRDEVARRSVSNSQGSSTGAAPSAGEAR